MLHMERIILLGTDQLPGAYIMTIHDVKALCHTAFICQQINAYTGMLQLSREYMTQCMYLGMGSVGSLASVLRYWRG